MNNNLHILFLCGWYPSRVIPNNGDFIQRHAEAVNTLHKVSVLHIISDPNYTKAIEIISKRINGVNTHIAYVKPSKNPLVKVFRFVKAFKILLNTISNFDVVHLNKLFPFGILALFLKLFKNKNYIITEHWTTYHFPQSKEISALEVFLSKIIAKNATFLCPVSDDLKSSMLKLNLKGNYKTIPNVVNTKTFIPSQKEGTVFNILHVSNMLDKHKNISGIIKTIKKFSQFTTNFKLTLIGENAIKYRSLSNELNISKYINFVEHIPHKEVINFMQQADIFVLFSNYENLPCVILESFSCGTPVISTNVGGISEFFPSDFGFLIPLNNEDELLKKLINIYNNPIHKKEELHAYAKQNFSNTAIAESFSKLYLHSCI